MCLDGDADLSWEMCHPQLKMSRFSQGKIQVVDDPCFVYVPAKLHVSASVLMEKGQQPCV